VVGDGTVELSSEDCGKRRYSTVFDDKDEEGTKHNELKALEDEGKKSRVS